MDIDQYIWQSALSFVVYNKGTLFFNEHFIEISKLSSIYKHQYELLLGDLVGQ